MRMTSNRSFDASGTPKQRRVLLKLLRRQAAAVSLLGLCAIPALATSFTYTTISDPAAGATRVFGISNNGNILVGDHAGGGIFTYSSGTFTEYGSQSDGRSNMNYDGRVNNAGDIVGTDGSLAAFSLIDGTATVLLPPGATQSFGDGINDSGLIAGGTGTSGFLYQNGTYTYVNVPGASYTGILSLDSAGDSAGFYGDNTGTHGFYLENGVYTTFDYGSNTYLWGINANGDLAGNSNLGAFFYDGATFTAIAVPGATSTQVLGMNDLGELVGDYQTADGQTLGFVAVSDSVAATPEPGSLGLALLGLAAVLLPKVLARRPPSESSLLN